MMKLSVRIYNHKTLGPLALIASGVILGVACGCWIGRVAAMHSAKASLSRYAEQLALRGDEFMGELKPIFHQVNRSASPFCSDADMADLRALTFHARDIKDIGRTRDGKLFCSAFLGRLSVPYDEGTPTLRLADRTNIYADVDVVLASSGAGHGTVIEFGGVDAVLNPSIFQPAFGSHAKYQIIAVNLRTQQYATIAGSSIGLLPPSRRTSQFTLKDGVLYRYEYSEHYPLCVVASEGLSELLKASRGTVIAYSFTGGLAGLSFALSLAFLFARYSRTGPQLHRAIKKRSNQLTVVYQPILDVKSQRCVGAEALIRWNDKQARAIAPDIFVAVAEREGFISELTAFVVERAIHDLGEHLRKNVKFTLSINIAVADLSDESFFEHLRKEVQQAGIRPEQIALELTERSTADMKTICSAIRRLRSYGYKVHIDDFGTGFSSLSYLDQLDVNAIKIDRAFTRSIGTGAVTSTILPQMLTMAKNLNLEVIVEGVESELQNKYLSRTGQALRAQGWLFGRPMSANAFASAYANNAPVQHEKQDGLAIPLNASKRKISNDSVLQDEALAVS